MKDFFISYNKADRAWAEWIAWQLKEAGYSTVIQAWDFVPGTHFIHEMQKSAIDSEKTIAVLSPDYLRAEYTQPEWEGAYLKDPNGNKRTLIPMRVHPCEPKGLLEQIVYVDLVNRNETDAKELILKSAMGQSGPPATAPPFPAAPSSTPLHMAGPKFPGALPSVWNIPHLQNPNFTGREDILQQIHSALTSGGTAPITQAQAIHGLGGIGKTQAAVEYAYRHKSEYEKVWWIRSEESITLAGDYAALAAELSLPEKDTQDQKIIIASVKKWLSRNGKWLLIFDNAVDTNAIHDYLPQGNAGHIIITSRDPNWNSLGKPLKLDIWERSQSKQFILRRTGVTDETKADALASVLGDLPLALEQAAAYITETGTAIADYIILFNTRHAELLKQHHGSRDYPFTVATTWSFSFKNVEESSHAAADLLRLCSFLAPDDIPSNYIRDNAEELPEPLLSVLKDELKFNEAVRLIKKYSLAEIQNGTMNMHRLVQVVMRDSIDDATKRDLVERGAKVLVVTFPEDIDTKIELWKLCIRLIPHVHIITEYAEKNELQTETIAQLLNGTGVFLTSQARYEIGLSYFDKSLTIYLKIFGEQHKGTATGYNNIGIVWKDLGDIKKAIEYFEKALAIDINLFGEYDTKIATRYNNIGMAWSGLGNNRRAINFLEKALAIEINAYGEQHYKVGINYSNFATVWGKLGNYNKSIKYLEKALSIDIKEFGEQHHYTARDYNNLGQAYKQLGSYKKAIEYLTKAVNICMEVLGPDHPYTITSKINLKLARKKR